MEAIQSYSLYNADKKELFAVFKTSRDAAKYALANYRFFKEPTQAIVRAALSKRRFESEETNFSFAIAIRRTQENHLHLIDGSDFWIKEGYPSPNIPHKKMAAQ